MGGLAVKVSDIDDQLHVVTITPAGLIFLAERGHFSEVSDDDIRDKSNVDIFAKCLVILQVTWIAVQTISRKATGYPLSPLKIHTLVHVACASFMYILWFQKPLDVQAPVIFSKAGFQDWIALMLMQSPRIGTTWYSQMDPPKDFTPNDRSPRSEASFLMFDHAGLAWRDERCSSCGWYLDPNPTAKGRVAENGVLHDIPQTCDSCVDVSKWPQQARTSAAGTLSSQITLPPSAVIRCRPPPGVRSVYHLRSGELIPEGIGLLPLKTWASYHDNYVPRPWVFTLLKSRPPELVLPAQVSRAVRQRLPSIYPQPYYWHEIKLSLSEKDHRRWKLAGAAFSKGIGIDPGFERYRALDLNCRLWGFLGPPTLVFLVRCCPNLSWNFQSILRLVLTQPPTLLLTLWLLTSLYGGIHLALWNFDFSTLAKTFLWRMSTATLGSVPGLLLFVGLLFIAYIMYDKSKILDRGRRRSCLPEWHRVVFPGCCISIGHCLDMFCFVVGWMIALAVVSGLPLYIFARIFVVVESFVSLRHVPIGVYEGGLGWSKYIPHL